MKKIKIKKKNLFSKLIIKIIRKLGYEIIDQNSLTISTRNKQINENLSILNNKNISLPLGEVKSKRNIKSLLIIFRSFTNENKLLSQNKKRLFEKEKKEYSLRSLISICKNISNSKKEFKDLDIFLKIIDDNSQKNVIDEINLICNKFGVVYEISNLNLSKYKDKMKFKDSKRMLSHNSHIFQSKEFALQSDFDLLYFVEDDYIHEEDALVEMIYSYQKFSSQLDDEVILCPVDYPYLYMETNDTKNFIGFNKHWRLINQTLCTYLISKKTLNKYWSYYEDMFLNNYDPYEKPLHELYKKINCFSPIPSLALHLTNVNSIYGLSPLKDWVNIWEKNKFQK
tara:strand:+ start:356 stop:1375 length:1020 start_codon:yes stop_codon:yes gene_type:complete